MSDYITGLTNQYVSSDYSQSTSALKDTLNNTDFSNATDEELMEACKSFESYLVEQVFKGMEKMIPKDDDESGSSSYTEMFKDTLYQEYAEKATEQGDGLGIAQMLYKQMKRNYDI